MSACAVCGVARPPGSHHCRACDVCTVDFDHHCGILGRCIAQGNRRPFIALLTAGGLSLSIVGASGACVAWDELQTGHTSDVWLLSQMLSWRFLYRFAAPTFIFGSVGLTLVCFAAAQASLFALGLTMHTASRNKAAEALSRCCQSLSPFVFLRRCLEGLHDLGDFARHESPGVKSFRLLSLYVELPWLRFVCLMSVIIGEVAYVLVFFDKESGNVWERVSVASTCACCAAATALIARFTFDGPTYGAPHGSALWHRHAQADDGEDVPLSAPEAPTEGAAESLDTCTECDEGSSEGGTVGRCGSDVEVWASSATWCTHGRTARRTLQSHCKHCSTCVQGRSHHCGAFILCIGDDLRRPFICLMLSIIIGTLGPAVHVAQWLWADAIPSMWSALTHASSLVEVGNLAASGVWASAWFHLIGVTLNATVLLLQQLVYLGYARGCLHPNHWCMHGLLTAFGMKDWGAQTTPQRSSRL